MVAASCCQELEEPWRQGQEELCLLAVAMHQGLEEEPCLLVAASCCQELEEPCLMVAASCCQELEEPWRQGQEEPCLLVVAMHQELGELCLLAEAVLQGVPFLAGPQRWLSWLVGVAWPHQH